MLIASVWRSSSRSYFVLGLLLGGALMALVLVVLGSVFLRSWIPAGAALGVVMTVIVYAVLHDSILPTLPMPQNARQVPELVVGSGPRLGALQFGLEMGTGMRTFMTSMSPHMLGAALLVLLPWQQALVAGAAFGAGRAIVPLARAFGDNDASWSAQFARHERTIRSSIAITSATGWVVVILGGWPWQL